MKNRKRKILFFISGVIPTDLEAKQGVEINAAFRCTKFIGEETPVEACDAVCGAIPKQYQALVDDKNSPVELAELPEIDNSGKDKDKLKAVLTERRIKFRENASFETLQKLVAESEAGSGLE